MAPRAAQDTFARRRSVRRDGGAVNPPLGEPGLTSALLIPTVCTEWWRPNSQRKSLQLTNWLYHKLTVLSFLAQQLKLRKKQVLMAACLVL